MCIVCILLFNITNYRPVFSQQSLKNCPQECLCTAEDSTCEPAVRVQCGERNLTSVPNRAIFDIRVSLLNVSFNDLNSLEDNTFFQYESVKYIYLEHCKIHSISEETFKSLMNLTIVDLSNNLLNSISPNLFNCNRRLDKLFLGYNDFSTLEWNTTLLNGPPSLSFLCLQSCQISNLSSETLSSLPNLKTLDISCNNLDRLHFDILSAHQLLQDVNLENNRFKCGVEFKKLCSWMQSNPSLFHNRTLTCGRKKHEVEICTPETQSFLYHPTTTLSVTPSYESLFHNRSLICGYKKHEVEKCTPETQSSLYRSMTTPPFTPSYEPVTNTSTKLESSVTPSNKPDVSRNTTNNHTTPTGSELIAIILITVVVGIIFLSIVMCVKCCRKNNSKQRDRQNNTEELIALDNPTQGNMQNGTEEENS